MGGGRPRAWSDCCRVTGVSDWPAPVHLDLAGGLASGDGFGFAGSGICVGARTAAGSSDDHQPDLETWSRADVRTGPRPRDRRARAEYAASAVLLTIRLRRARGKERQQLKWIAYAAGLFAVGVGALSFAPPAWTALAAGVFALTGAGLTTAVGVAILRYQRFDIDVLINRTLI